MNVLWLEASSSVPRDMLSRWQGGFVADAWRTRAATGRPLVYLQRSAVSRVKNPCTRSTTQKLNSAALAVERRCPCRLCHRGTPTLPSSSPRPSWLRNAGHWRISVPNGRHLVSYGTLLHQCGAVVPDGSNISAHPALDQCAIRGWPQQQLQLVPIRQIRFDPVLPGVPFQHHGPAVMDGHVGTGFGGDDVGRPQLRPILTLPLLTKPGEDHRVPIGRR